MFPEELVFARNKQEEIFEMKPEYPYIIRKVYPKQGKMMIAPWHWHEELEFVCITKGTVIYNTLQGEILVREGDGMFINSNVLHRVTAASPQEEVSYEVHMFRRSFLAGEGSLLDKKYVRPLLRNQSVTSIHLEEKIESNRNILDGMCQLAALNDNKPYGYEVKLRNLLFEVWIGLLEIQREYPEIHSPDTFHKEMRLKEMMLYIQEHYMEKISLRDIAGAVNISERECLRCFRSGLGTTPFAYLLEYRIQEACDMLQNTSERVIDIAVQCGFNSSSYFGKTFRRQMNCTPYEYRNM